MSAFYDFLLVSGFILVVGFLVAGLCMVGYAVVAYYGQPKTPVWSGRYLVLENGRFLAKYEDIKQAVTAAKNMQDYYQEYLMSNRVTVIDTKNRSNVSLINASAYA
jgi:hypothetical protein